MNVSPVLAAIRMLRVDALRMITTGARNTTAQQRAESRYGNG